MEILTLILRNFTKLLVLRYLGVYNVLYEVSVPSLPIESTNSMINAFVQHMFNFHVLLNQWTTMLLIMVILSMPMLPVPTLIEFLN